MLDSMLLESAGHIFLHTQPYLLASYLFCTRWTPSGAFKRFNTCCKTSRLRTIPEPSTFWGLLLLNAGDPVGAVERFREAVRVSNDSDIRARAYTNWAAALYRQAQ
jgi:tetratricopeptide (TPR) repeat protein